MRIIDVIAICIVWMAGSCASTSTVIQDLQFERRPVVYKESSWHIQTNSRPDSVSWKMSDPVTGQVVLWQEPTKLGFISVSPFVAKGKVGFFISPYSGRFMFEIRVWGGWIDEKHVFYREIFETDQLWESLNIQRIMPRRP